MLAFITWWLLVEILGLAALPVAFRLFRNLPDRGYAFAKPLGLLLTAYSLWVLVTFGFLRHTWSAIVFLILALAVAGWGWGDRAAVLSFVRERRQWVVVNEAVFFVAFALWALFRAYNPEIAATEKPMEFAFLNSIVRTETFPPPDPWLSGFAISYYYFGYLMVALLTRLSGLPTEVTFNLAVALLFAWTVTGAFSLVFNLVESSRRGDAGTQRRGEAGSLPVSASVLWGILGSFLVAIVGNLEGFLDVLHERGVGSAEFWAWLNIKDLTAPVAASGGWLPGRYMWWWRASRVVHDVVLGQESEVIDEFPFFSFLLGDLHPHVLALPFGLLALALALNVIRAERADRTGTMTANSGNLKAQFSNLRSLYAYLSPLLMPALILGALGFLNSWDWPTYSLIFIAAYGLRERLWRGTFDRAWLRDVATTGVGILVLGLLLYLPFYVAFQTQASGLRPVVFVKTHLAQYLVMFGLSLFAILSFLVVQFYSWWHDPRRQARLGPEAWATILMTVPVVLVSAIFQWWTAFLLAAAIGASAFLILQKLHVASTHPATAPEGVPVEAGIFVRPSTNPTVVTLFILLIVAAGLGLTLVTEFVYIKDTFNSRMNTVFKFYYQAWVLLAIAAAYATYWLVGRRSVSVPPVVRHVWGAAFALVLAMALVYPVGAAYTKANGFRGTPSLDGMAWFRQYKPAEYAAIQWLKTNAPDTATIVEATGGSYTEAGRVSMATGLPTLLGWDFHEQQWRGNYEEPGKRQPLIAQIYQSTDQQAVAKILADYNVSFVFLGDLERQKYNLAQPQVDKFKRFMDLVYDQAGVLIFRRR